MSKPTTQDRHKKIADFLNSETGRDFVAWWKNHRHSGYATRGSQERWGIDPYKASRCDRYMAEYCSDRGLYQETRFEYSASDYERWAQEQRAADDAVLSTPGEFLVAFSKCVSVLRAKFQAK